MRFMRFMRWLFASIAARGAGSGIPIALAYVIAATLAQSAFEHPICNITHLTLLYLQPISTADRRQSASCLTQIVSRIGGGVNKKRHTMCHHGRRV